MARGVCSFILHVRCPRGMSFFGFWPPPTHPCSSIHRWSLCMSTPRLACPAYPDVLLNRNKTVLNSTPDTPLLFLFLQLIIAVVFLHVSALFSSRVEIPQWDLFTAKKLLPVVTINIVGLVFNTLCLREVEATFFQVLIIFFSPRCSTQYRFLSDCKRLGLALDYCRHLRHDSLSPFNPCHHCSWHSFHGIFRRCRTNRKHSRCRNPIAHQSILRRIFLSGHCYSYGPNQVLSPLLQQLDYPTRLLDKCGFCDPRCSVCVAPRGTYQDFGIEC
jgi:hypothetical protein